MHELYIGLYRTDPLKSIQILKKSAAFAGRTAPHVQLAHEKPVEGDGLQKEDSFFEETTGALIRRSACLAPHSGHWTSSSFSLENISFSKKWPHSAHPYS